MKAAWPTASVISVPFVGRFGEGIITSAWQTATTLHRCKQASLRLSACAGPKEGNPQPLPLYPSTCKLTTVETPPGRSKMNLDHPYPGDKARSVPLHAEIPWTHLPGMWSPSSRCCLCLRWTGRELTCGGKEG